MEIFRQIFGVSAVLLLLVAFVWWTRRGGKFRVAGWQRPAGTGKSIERVERISLTPQNSLHVVRFGGQHLLIGVHASGCVLLDKRSAPSIRETLGDPAPNEAGA